MFDFSKPKVMPDNLLDFSFSEKIALDEHLHIINKKIKGKNAIEFIKKKNCWNLNLILIQMQTKNALRKNLAKIKNNNTKKN